MLAPEDVTNSRPVANIPFLVKLIERVVADQLQTFLEESDTLDPFQSGTKTVLVTLLDDLLKEVDQGSVTLLVLLDLSVAVDTVNHGSLLDRHLGLGMRGSVLL